MTEEKRNYTWLWVALGISAIYFLFNSPFDRPLDFITIFLLCFIGQEIYFIFKKERDDVK
jgi:hypothetical protein